MEGEVIVLQTLAVVLPEQLFTQLVVGVPVGVLVYLVLWASGRRRARAKRAETIRNRNRS